MSAQEDNRAIQALHKMYWQQDQAVSFQNKNCLSSTDWKLIVSDRLNCVRLSDQWKKA